MNLTVKQEKFCVNYFECGNATQAALAAGYAPKYAAQNVPKLLKCTNIALRLKELQDKIATDKVMSKQERMERLSEIGRARITDYQESGQDGGWINIGKESPNTAAVSEITSTTKYDDNGSQPTLITKVRLHNPIQAIDLLNKMDNVYQWSEETHSTNVNVNNIIVQVVSENAKLLTERIMAGERTESISLSEVKTDAV